MAPTRGSVRNLFALRLLLALWLAAAMQLAAFAESRYEPYLSLDGGVVFMHSADATLSGGVNGEASFDTGFRTDLSFGVTAKEGALFSYGRFAGITDIALEFDTGVVWTSGKVSGSSGSSVIPDLNLLQIPLLLDLCFQVPVSDHLSVSLGAGAGGILGFASGQAQDAGTASDTAAAFAWQILTRITYRFNDHVSVGAFYKFLGTGSTSYGDGLDLKLDNTYSHTLGLSATWVF
jgi:opacity protein-like surface antigen